MSVTEKSKIELLKEESRGLRGQIREELLADDAQRFSQHSEHLIKFHGMYQYKDRDRRKPGEDKAPPKPFTLMVRGRIPGGRISPEAWQKWDEIADRYAVSGLRITTRQSLQLHGVLKSNIKKTIQEIHAALSTTTGACGDVVRNVVQAVNPWGDPTLLELNAAADLLSQHFEVESDAYLEIFLDKEPVVQEREDRIYGTSYLPRKFKVGITKVGNNSIDIYTQDLGFAATFNVQNKIEGYFVFAGGGMGMSHSDQQTHPRLADLLGWIPASAFLATAEAIVTTQRDFGNRENRTFARLKYLIDAKGVSWFKDEVSRRSGFEFEDRPLPPWQTPNHLGWSTAVDGTLSLGFHTLSGRLTGDLKRAVAYLVRHYQLPVQLTAEQDLILLGVQPKDKQAIESYLDSFGLSPLSPWKLYNRALTCVALPTCVKALAEAERIGPDLFRTIQDELTKLQLSDKAPVVRITGCPNGCARPYMAELALVGQLPGHYAVFLGGNSEGQRLAFKVKDKVKYEDLPKLFATIFGIWHDQGQIAELLGDFAFRFGAESWKEVL